MTTVNNRKYKAKKFTSIDAANSFMISNPEFGVLKVVKRDTIYISKQITIWVARINDLGISN